MTRIEKGIPFPSDRKAPVLPLDQMEIGDSILVESHLRRHFYYATKLLAPKRFLSRSVTQDGLRRVRIWRVE